MSIPEGMVARRATGVLILPKENPVIVEKYIQLVGPLASHSGVLNGIRFERGVHRFRGPMAQAEGLIRYCQRCWQATVHDNDPRESSHGVSQVPSPEAEGLQRGAPEGRGQPADGAAEERRGDAGDEAGPAEDVPSSPDSAGSAEPVADVDHRLLAAIDALDPEQDEHWTTSGKPAMAAVEALYGSAGITRRNVEEARPGYDRDAARAVKSQ